MRTQLVDPEIRRQRAEAFRKAKGERFGEARDDNDKPAPEGVTTANGKAKGKGRRAADGPTEDSEGALQE